jgi:hypothetical protein
MVRAAKPGGRVILEDDDHEALDRLSVRTGVRSIVACLRARV